MDNRIWREDDFFEVIPQGRIDMDPSVVEFPESAPLVWGFYNKNLYGHAKEIQLIEGEIVCELNFFKSNDEEQFENLKDDIRLGGCYSGVEFSEDGKRVTRCVLRSVSIIPLASSPGYNKKEE